MKIKKIINNSDIIFKDNVFDFIRVKKTEDENFQNCLIKYLKNDIDNTKIKYFKNLLNYEYQFIKDLNIINILKPNSVFDSGQEFAVIYEDFNGYCLREIIHSSENIDYYEKLLISVNLAKIITQIHNLSIIHNFIKPESFLYDPVTKNIKITNFYYAHKSNILALFSGSDDFSETFPDSNSICYKTIKEKIESNNFNYSFDLYALGLILYELFTKQSPSKNNFLYPSEIDSRIDIHLSNIIVKIISSNPEYRYNTASGIYCDLKKCMNQYEKNGKLYFFELGKEDKTKPKLFEDFFNIGEEIIIFLNDKYIFQYVNNNFQQIFNIEKQSIIGKNVFELTGDNKFNKNIKKAIDQCLKGEKGGIELWFESEKNTKKYFNFRLYPYYEKSDKVSGIVVFANDITNQKLYENSLKETEIRYKGLFDNLKTGVAIYEAVNDGQDFIFKDFNRAAEILDKTNKEDLFEKSVCKVFPGVKEFGLFDIFQIVWKEGKSKYFPISFYKDNKISGWRNNYVFKIDSGEIIAIYEDVTERMQMIEELKISKNSLSLILEACGAGTWQFNPITFQDVVYNDRWFRMLGYSTDELPHTAETWKSLVHPDDLDDVNNALSNFLNNKGDYITEFRMKAKNGSYKWIFSKGDVVKFDNDGNPIKMMGIHIDIDEKKRSEDEIKWLRNYLKNIIDSMPSVIIAVNKNQEITQFNSEAKKVFGFDSNHALGKKIKNIIPDFKNLYEKIEKTFIELNPQKIDKVSLDYNNISYLFDITIYPILSNKIEGSVIRMDDISSRVRLEEMMIQSEKMLSIGGLAAGMAHEINNPLAGILQSAQVILNRITKKIPANLKAAERSNIDIDSLFAYIKDRKIDNMIENVIEIGKRAAVIVQNMLNFSRKSNSGILGQDIRELMDDALELASNDYDLKKHYDFKQIKIIKEYDDYMPDVDCNRIKIQQVFLNIIKNGAYAMRTNPFQNKESFFIIKIKKDNNKARIEIQDNGHGINEEVRKRIFEPFFTTKEVGEGTGLGLSVSYFIICENHHGDMTVESKPGKGANFIITLPLKMKIKNDSIIQ